MNLDLLGEGVPSVVSGNANGAEWLTERLMAEVSARRLSGMGALLPVGAFGAWLPAKRRRQAC